jgi:hypothetical protein
VHAQFSVLTFTNPGGSVVPIGLLLFDPEAQLLLVRCRHDWDRIADPEDAEVLSALSEDLVRVARDLGAANVLEYLENTLSNSIEISARQRIETTNLEDAIEDLYIQHVDAGSHA